MTKVETETGQMITALRDGLHGLHISRMALVGEARALRLAGRKAEREKVWSRVEEITAQIEVTTRELAEHMLREEETQRRRDAETRRGELMPCPFCGGGAEHLFGMDEHWCFCTVCGSAGQVRGTRQEAVDCWNTRTAYLPDGRASGRGTEGSAGQTKRAAEAAMDLIALISRMPDAEAEKVVNVIAAGLKVLAHGQALKKAVAK